MPIEKKYFVDFEMTDAGKPIGAWKSDDFIYNYLVNQQLINIQNKVSGLACKKHKEIPEVETAITDKLLTVIRVKCCCLKFRDIVCKQFNAFQQVKQ